MYCHETESCIAVNAPYADEWQVQYSLQLVRGDHSCGAAHVLP